MMNPFRYVSPKEMVCRILIGAVILGLFILQVIVTYDFMGMRLPSATLGLLTMKSRTKLYNARTVIKASALGVLAVNSALSSNSVPGSMMLLTACLIPSSPITPHEIG